MKYKDVLEILESSILNLIDTISQTIVFIFGTNGYTEYVLNLLYENGISVKAIVDNDVNKQGGKVFNVPVVAPEYLQNQSNAAILIFSQYCYEMKKQIVEMNAALDNSVYIIYDFVDFNDSIQREKRFWEPETFETKMNLLEQGRNVYEEIRKEYTGTMILSPTISIGDNFLWELSFTKYKEMKAIKDYFIVVVSKGAYKAIKLYKEEGVLIIDKNQMESLIKFVMFLGEDVTDSLLVYPRHNNQRCFDTVSTYRGMGWHSMYKNGIFQLPKDVTFRFPSIHQGKYYADSLKEKGLKKGKSVILSPYANTVKELPICFWEELTKALLEKGYTVFTNTVGTQKSIAGSQRIDIPLDEVGNYLEYAGTFISIRNGLCDIAGKAKCNQIVIYRDQMTLHMPKVLFNDLHQDDLSPYSKALIWFEKDIAFNVNQVMDLIR